ncbi:hypothetical protein HYALB_00007965 [Hymenoscyphus albidus]|uniref:Uncharacterized protein n=1 Tax=Hymenoscyphus albidus TaxID=595503 RepID=A0A9N9LMY2_9HELO|nr:hypothetical protein HYALB_00007965 [Hymenoscyphus albidus]
MSGTHPQASSSRNVGPSSRASSNYTTCTNSFHPHTSHQQPQGSQSNITSTSHQPLTTQAIQAHNLHQLSLHQDPSYLTNIQQGQVHLIGCALDSLDGFSDTLPQYLRARVVYETPGMATMERFETSSSYPLRSLNEYEASFDGVCEDLQQQQQADTRAMATMERFETWSSYPSRTLSVYETPSLDSSDENQHQHQNQSITPPFPSSSQHPSLPTPNHHHETSSTHPQPPHTPQDHNPYPQNQHLNPTYPSYPSPIDQTQTLSRIGTQFPVYASCASPSPSQVHAQEIYIAIRKAYVGSQW